MNESARNTRFTRNTTLDIIKKEFKEGKKPNFKKVSEQIWKRFKVRTHAVIDKGTDKQKSLRLVRRSNILPNVDKDYFVLHEKRPFAGRIDKAEFEKNLGNYKTAIKIIQSYLENIGDKEEKIQFCLKLFLAQLFSQIGDHKNSKKCYQEADKFLKDNQDKILEADEEIFNELDEDYFLRKAIKHQKLRESPTKQEAIEHPEKVLARSVYAKEDLTDEDFKLLEILFGTMVAQHDAVKKVMQWCAADAVTDFKHPRFLVYESKYKARGAYNSANTIHLKANGPKDLCIKNAQAEKSRDILFNYSYSPTIFHESIHKMLHSIYHNKALPYLPGEKGEIQREAYQEALRKSILAGISGIVPFDELKKMNASSKNEFEIKLPGINSEDLEFMPFSNKVNLQFPVPWTEDMSLADILKNLNYEYEGASLCRHLVQLGNDVNILTRGKISIPLKTSFMFIDMTDSVLEYSAQNFHIEFITHYMENLSSSNINYKNLYDDKSPFYIILQFFEQYIVPDIEKSLSA